MGDSPLDTIIRESVEEALLPSDFARTHIRPTGAVSFLHMSAEKWILPGMYYTYDLRLPSDGSIQPRPNADDGEVESFGLMGAQEVLERLLNGEFKASSALALVDFFVRWGLITPESEARYAEVCMSLRRRSGLPMP
jgi:hypothetical protein